jgi:hypothetical protein
MSKIMLVVLAAIGVLLVMSRRNPGQVVDDLKDGLQNGANLLMPDNGTPTPPTGDQTSDYNTADQKQTATIVPTPPISVSLGNLHLVDDIYNL